MRNPFRRMTAEEELARDREEDARIQAEIAADPDMMLITMYTLKALTPQEKAAFEERLDRDPEFYERAAPILAVCSLPRWHEAPSEAMLDRAWAEFCERVGDPPELSRTRTTGRGGEHTTLRVPRRWKLKRRWWRPFRGS